MLKIMLNLPVYLVLLRELNFLSVSEGLDCYSCLYEPVFSVDTVQASTHRIFLDKVDYQSCLDYTEPNPKLKRHCDRVQINGKEIQPVCGILKAETGIIMGKVSHFYEVIGRGCFHPNPNFKNGIKRNRMTCSQRTFSNLTRISARPMEGPMMTVGKYSNRNKTIKFCYCSSDNCNHAGRLIVNTMLLGLVGILLLMSFAMF